jgi:alkyl hydroperoxide reductase subunit AhpF
METVTVKIDCMSPKSKYLVALLKEIAKESDEIKIEKSRKPVSRKTAKKVDKGMMKRSEKNIILMENMRI